jgi:hypothetical protein
MHVLVFLDKLTVHFETLLNIYAQNHPDQRSVPSIPRKYSLRAFAPGLTSMIGTIKQNILDASPELLYTLHMDDSFMNTVEVEALYIYAIVLDSQLNKPTLQRLRFAKKGDRRMSGEELSGAVVTMQTQLLDLYKQPNVLDVLLTTQGDVMKLGLNEELILNRITRDSEVTKACYACLNSRTKFAA